MATCIGDRNGSAGLKKHRSSLTGRLKGALDVLIRWSVDVGRWDEIRITKRIFKGYPVKVSGVVPRRKIKEK